MQVLREKMTRLDDEIRKVVKPAEEPAVIQGEAELVLVKKRINKAELKKKIQEFNRNLELAQIAAKKEETQNEQATKSTADEESPLANYLKYKDLAYNQTTTFNIKLPLPKAYSLLFDAFKASDTIVKLLFNRGEICTFQKLKKGIENITKHTFSLNHLSQIKTVYPQAYLIKQEKLFIGFKNDYHLTEFRWSVSSI